MSLHNMSKCHILIYIYICVIMSYKYITCDIMSCSIVQKHEKSGENQKKAGGPGFSKMTFVLQNKYERGGVTLTLYICNIQRDTSPL